MNGSVIPAEERFPRLKEVLLGFAKSLADALKNKPSLLAAQPPDAFWSLVLPWLIELEVPSPSSELIERVNARKAEISQTGFEGDKIAKQLLEIRNSDLHLSECCPNLAILARHFSRNFLHDATPLATDDFDLIGLEKLYEAFVTLTYEQGRFRRSSFTHVFNLEIEGRDLQIGNIWILRLNPDFKGIVLGEKTPQPFLHPPNVGECFIYVNEGASDQNDDE